MATHFGIFAWKIPWREEPGGLQSMGSQEILVSSRYMPRSGIAGSYGGFIPSF